MIELGVDFVVFELIEFNVNCGLNLMCVVENKCLSMLCVEF